MHQFNYPAEIGEHNQGQAEGGILNRLKQYISERSIGGDLDLLLLVEDFSTVAFLIFEVIYLHALINAVETFH
ncbi:hypothetical protein C7B65_00190 [Phormidesmis priestleyi ULC007]|uniref:Uncharacterized protein n=1 Tax=Phormidesmis priestleyi ULC007 TaxID=1920490 RepID=A0A2T1DN90_9CYAN|nr:hypothetical protein C7B65_00190 [Phormidesmis priestleyi ULC007]PZO50540.1 MAG: hypothetical protein DCF14_11480 [Phormidesmis priestleyi]